MEPEPDRVDEIVSEVLDRALRRQAVDLEGILAAHPELTEEERRRVRARASLVAASRDEEFPLPFDRLGEFRILRRLGAGSMGVVYLAEQTSLGRPVALKVIRPEHSGSAEAAARFEREARAVAQLRHPNIVAIHAAGEDQGIRYLVMDLVPGIPLDELLRRASARGEELVIARILRFGIDVADALACAHAAGILHRDVKPSNIRITDGDRAMLVDFGLARLADSGALQSSATFLGSPAYASPEQVEGKRSLDASTDVYSLGVTLYECLSGALPFRGSSSAEVLQRILRDDPPPFRLRDGRRLPPDLETILAKALEKDPRQRYSGAAALAADLRAFLEYRPISARPAGPLTRARKWCRRHRGAAVGGGFAGTTALAFLGFLGWQRAEASNSYRFEIARAESARSAGDFDASIRALDRALALRPGDAVAAARRSEVALERNAVAAAAARRSARGKLDAIRALLADAASADLAAAPLRRERNTRFLTPEEHAQIARSDDALAELARAFEREFFEAEEVLNDAERLQPQASENSELRAELWLERWRDARRRGDAASSEFFATQVERNDPQSRHANELRPRGALRFAAEPAGAEVFLFEYREHASLVPGGDHRLVPVPWNGAATPVPPGTWCLRVVEPLLGIERDDVLFRLAGRPIEGVLLVPRTSGAIRALDRLVSIDGSPLREAYDASKASAREPGPGERHDFEFERDGQRFTLEAPSLRALGIRAWEPDSIAWEAPCRVDLARDGKVLAVDLPGGLAVRTTGAPLFLSPQNRLGAAPVELSDLAPGSYLAVVRHPAHESQRVPFVVEGRKTTEVHATLLPLGTTPRGFVYVPPGPFRAGGDPEAFAAWPGSTRDLPGFWIQEREVAEEEYVAFLNDPTRTAKVALEAALARAPDAPGVGIVRGDDGKYATRFAPLSPMTGVPWPDALAFARWRTGTLRKAGYDLVADLPTEEEWEKAARGVDGRSFVFGNRFNPTWAKTRFAHDEIGKEISLRFPIDESPYGAFDMTGSQWEWCLDEWKPGVPGRTARGGAWSFLYEANFRAASRAELEPESEDNPTGIRLVLRRPARPEPK